MKSVTADKLPNMHSTDYRGIPLVVQWPKGSTRVGENSKGEQYKIEMKADYGYIPATVDIDRDDHLDVYIGPNKDSEYAYVLEQMQDGKFDEYKIMLGYDSLEEAEQSYLDHLPEEMLGEITEVPFDYLLDTYKKEEPWGEADEEEIHDARAEKHKQGDADQWGDMIPGAEDSHEGPPNVVPEPKEDEPWYHGRRGEHTFDPSRPAFFAREREGAGWYAHERGRDDAQPNIGEYRLDIKKPARLRDLMAVVDKLGVTDEDIQQHSVYEGENDVDYLYVPKVREALKAGGFDGFVGWDTLSNGDLQIAVPFGTSQIKHTKTVTADDERLSLIEAFVKLYKHEFEYFDKVADEVHDQLSEALQSAGIRAIVTYRAKKPRKLKEKLLKRGKTKSYQSFQDIYNDISDMAGVRVALYLPNDRTVVGQLIEQQFTQMRAAKNFPEDKAPEDSIGYVATHYLVRLKPESLHKDEYQYADTNVEIQVASVLMHAWSEICHDLTYKPEKGPLTPEEVAMLDDLNRVVQEGEAVLEKLQQSVESRSHEDLRFELAAALTKLAKRLGTQSKGRAMRRITASDVKTVAKHAMEDLYTSLMQSMKDLGWNYAENDNWSDPVKPQEQIQVFHDGWIHRAWDKIEASGSTAQELQEYLGKRGLGDAKHQHKIENQPPLPPHVSYLKAKLALWKAHGKPGITE
jgi:ppGpp synthetase/RelA/SpoT-type nucleotidyltranferase